MMQSKDGWSGWRLSCSKRPGGSQTGSEMGWLRVFLAGCRRVGMPALVAALAFGLTGCAWSPVKPYTGQAPRLETVYVIASSWHTEIGVPTHALSGPLVSLQPASRDARFLVFGWGQRDYYMARDPGLGDLLGAAGPSPAVMLVIPLQKPPPEFFAAPSSVFTIRVSREGLDRLAQFLSDYLEKDPALVPRRIGDGPYRGSAFYAAIGTYSLGNTCNTWTAEALRVSGLPVTAAGVVFAHDVVAQVRGLAVPQQ